MADRQERTEKATPERLRQARRQGRVVQSNDLVAALVLLAALFVLPSALGDAGRIAGRLVGGGLREALRPDAAAGDFQETARAALFSFGAAFAPLVAVCLLVAIAASLLQSGFLIRPAALVPCWERLSPASGLRRLASLSSAWRTLSTLAKFLGVTLAFVWGLLPFLQPRGELSAASLMATTLPAALERSGSHILHVGVVAAAGLAALGAIDWLFQRWRFEADLRMTRQEVLEEFQSQEGNRQVKRAIHKKVAAVKRSGTRKRRGVS